MDSISKTVIRMCIILACSVAAGYLLLVAAFMIPQERLIMNLANSVSALQRDSLEDVIVGYPNSRLDVYSDGAMLNMVLHTNEESPFKRAAAGYVYYSEGKTPEQTFVSYFAPEYPQGEVEYQRYWHGYLAPLKFLFAMFNYSDIRMINSLGQIMILSLTVCAFAGRRLYKYIPAVFLVYFFLMPYTLPLSLQYSTDFYIGFTMLFILVLCYDRLNRGSGVLYLFLLSGVLTSYFDLLTYPVFTLGLPLTGLLIVMYEDRQSHSPQTFAEGFIRFALSGISWGIGYAGMWIGKAVITIPFYGGAIFKDIWVSVKKRSLSGAAEEGFVFSDALNANFDMYKNPIYKYLLVAYVVLALIYIIYILVKKKGRLSFVSVPMYLLVIAIPFVWYFFTTEHATIHAFMTYKDLTVAVFAFAALPVSLCAGKNGDNEPVASDQKIKV